jgi:hypothetical protein
MERGIARFAPLTGFASVVLGIVAFVLAMTWADEPDPDAPAAEIALWMTDKSWEILISGWIWWLAAVAFLWFIGSLRSVLGPAEGGTRRVTSIAFSAGAVFTVFAASFFVPVVAGAAADEFDDRTISPETADVLWVLGNGVFGVAEITAAVMILAVAVVVVRTGALPTWYGWLSLLYGLWLLILPIGWIGMIGLPIWILLTTALVWMAESRPRPQAPTAT